MHVDVINPFIDSRAFYSGYTHLLESNPVSTFLLCWGGSSCAQKSLHGCLHQSWWWKCVYFIVRVSPTSLSVYFLFMPFAHFPLMTLFLTASHFPERSWSKCWSVLLSRLRRRIWQMFVRIRFVSRGWAPRERPMAVGTYSSPSPCHWTEAEPVPRQASHLGLSTRTKGRCPHHTVGLDQLLLDE